MFHWIKSLFSREQPPTIEPIDPGPPPCSIEPIDPGPPPCSDDECNFCSVMKERCRYMSPEQVLQAQAPLPCLMNVFRMTKPELDELAISCGLVKK